MRLLRFGLAAFCLLTVLSVAAPERLPIADFARAPDMSRARLSPDGGQIAYLADHFGLTKLHVLDLNTGQTIRLNLGEEQLINGFPKAVGTFVWVGNRRLILNTIVNDSRYGTLAIDSDGRRAVAISGLERSQDLRLQGDMRVAPSWAHEVIHAYHDANGSVLMLDRHETSPGTANRPDVIKVDTSTGLSKTFIKNPGKVAHWSIDFNGVARLGILSHGDLSGAIYRDSETSAWQTFLPLKNRRGEMRPLGFDAASNHAYVAALTADKRWAPFSLDPTTGKLGSPLLADALYDIVPDRFTPAIDGVSLAGPIFSPAKETMIGFRYYTESARVRWFDPEFVGYQRAVDKAMPDTVNLLVNQSNNGRRLLWFSFSDQHPGVYSLLDLEKRAFTAVAPHRSWINPAQMASTLAIKYQARDGLLLHGYLTVPLGHQPKGLPLVVMPHGGPWVRDVWGFDPLVQLLANRGYAVLQMNYRGSSGYGDELYQNARREIGGKIQEDIEDGTRWAIAAGVADPRRIGIFGMSYGGYSALFALGRTPELYRCGISFAGVTDWLAFLDDSDVADYKISSRYWREQLGEPDKDREKLKVASPVNFAKDIVAPVLIMQGRADPRVPANQARRMIAALEKAGGKPETLFLSGVGHNYGNERKKNEIFEGIVTFLEKNLGPGVADGAR